MAVEIILQETSTEPVENPVEKIRVNSLSF